jgi:glycosyltransferase involved in cell wall biosynthesis
MPVGVDTKRFKPNEHIQRKPHSILFLARMSPSKRPDILIGALALLAEKGTEFTASLVGSPLPRDRAWYEELKKSANLISGVQFHPGVANTGTSVLYSEHEFFVNASRSGMYDKTIFEALACGSLALAASKDYAEHADLRLTFDGSSEDLALKLGILLAMDGEEKQKIKAQTLELAKSHSLEILGNKIAHALI